MPEKTHDALNALFKMITLVPIAVPEDFDSSPHNDGADQCPDDQVRDCASE